jgi:hypothetical protein
MVTQQEESAVDSSPSRYEAIVEHLGRYRLSIRRVIEHLFFEGKSCSDVLSRLIEQQRVQDRSAQKGQAFFHGRVSYYQLTPREAARHQPSFPRNRAGLFEEYALLKHFSVLWFCCMGPQRRQRLEPEEVHEVCGVKVPRQGAYCINLTDPLRLYSVYVPGNTIGDTRLLKKVREDVETGLHQEQLSSWITDHHYAFAVLVQNRERQKGLEEKFTSLRADTRAHILVETVPSPHNLRRTPHARRKQT